MDFILVGDSTMTSFLPCATGSPLLSKHTIHTSSWERDGGSLSGNLHHRASGGPARADARAARAPNGTRTDTVAIAPSTSHAVSSAPAPSATRWARTHGESSSGTGTAPDATSAAASAAASAADAAR